MTQEARHTTGHDDARMIPVWSMVLAGVAFVLVEYYFWFVLPKYRHHGPGPLGLDIYFNLSWGILVALYFLLVGYVSKDAPRRGMSTRFWMLVCVVLPGGIGAVLYVLLRQPLLTTCPACGSMAQSDYHFCPQCAYQLMASCGKCYRSVRTTDQYCTRCGHGLAEDQMPARLRGPGN